MSDIISVQLYQFISDIEALSHIDYFGIDIANIVYDFFKIIKATPSFLSAYTDYDKMPIYILPQVEESQFDSEIFTKSMKLQQDIFLLKLTITYIENNMINNSDDSNDSNDSGNSGDSNDSDDSSDSSDSSNSSNSDDSSDSDESNSSLLSEEELDIPINNIISDIDFKDYMFKILSTYSEKRLGKPFSIDFVSKYKNIQLISNNKNIIHVTPNLTYCSGIYVTAISNIKTFIECIKSHNSFSTPIKENIKYILPNIIKKDVHNDFFSLHNIPNIVMYPFITNPEIYYNSLNKVFGTTEISLEVIHEFVTFAKKQVGYVTYMPFYKCMKTNSIKKTQQNTILLEYAKLRKDIIRINKAGYICKTQCSWSTESIFHIKFDMKLSITLDIKIAKTNSDTPGSKIKWNGHMRLLSRPPYNLRADQIEWIIPKLNASNFKSNVHETILALKLQSRRINPKIIATSFSSLNLSTEMRNTILKHFVENGSVRIHNNCILHNPHTKFIIGIDDPIPEIMDINFDMTYCLSCLKIQVPRYDVVLNQNKMEKIYHPVTQPCICTDCFDFLSRIIPNKSTPINITGEIIDLCLIREKFSILTMGFKYDDESIMYDSNLDVLHYIIHLHLGSIQLLQKII